MIPGRARWLLAASALALAAVPASGDRFWMQFLGKAMIGGIFAMSLDLLVGVSGLVSLAHAAFFGLSAYTLAGLSNYFALEQMALTLPISLATSAAAALAIGWLSLRAAGVYFIMVTLAFTQMLFYFFNDAPWFGGSDGLYVAIRPLSNSIASYYAILIAMVLVFIGLAALLRSAFGRVLVGVRLNQQRMQSLGYPARRHLLAAFVAAGSLAGLAGYLDANLYGFVNPALFGWRESGLVLMTVLLGGKGTLYGPLLGAFLLTFLQHYGEQLTDHWMAIIGFVVIAVVLFLPRGLAGLLEARRG